MASVLEYVLSGELDVDTLVSFLKKDTGNDGFVCKVSHGSANLLLQKGGGDICGNQYGNRDSVYR